MCKRMTLLARRSLRNLVKRTCGDETVFEDRAATPIASPEEDVGEWLEAVMMTSLFATLKNFKTFFRPLNWGEYSPKLEVQSV